MVEQQATGLGRSRPPPPPPPPPAPAGGGEAGNGEPLEQRLDGLSSLQERREQDLLAGREELRVLLERERGARNAVMLQELQLAHQYQKFSRALSRDTLLRTSAARSGFIHAILLSLVQRLEDRQGHVVTEARANTQLLAVLQQAHAEDNMRRTRREQEMVEAASMAREDALSVQREHTDLLRQARGLSAEQRRFEVDTRNMTQAVGRVEDNCARQKAALVKLRCRLAQEQARTNQLAAQCETWNARLRQLEEHMRL